MVEFHLGSLAPEEFNHMQPFTRMYGARFMPMTKDNFEKQVNMLPNETIE